MAGAYTNPRIGEGQSGSFDRLRTNGEVSRRAVLGAAVAIPFLPLDGGCAGANVPRTFAAISGGYGDRRMAGVDSDVGPGVSGASPGSTSTPTLPSPIRGEGNWRLALSAYRSAEAAVEEAGRVCAAASRAEIGAAEDAFGDRLEELYDSLRRLLAVPAPDLGAFLLKVDAAFEHEIGTLAETGPCVAAIREDVARIMPAVTN
jgi:hypothetical protein